MKAAVIAENTISYGDFPFPAEVTGGAVIEMRAAALTNLDIITAEGRHYFSPRQLPAVAGNEGVGTLSSGERRYFPVTSFVHPYGSFAERAVAKPALSLPIPSGISDAHAAALGNAGLAAWLPLSWQANIQPGETVTILGATGATGLIAVAAARMLGAGRIVAAGRNPAALEQASALGANTIVHLDREADLPGAVNDASAGGTDIILDYLNGPATAAALADLKVGGRLIQIGSALGPTIEISAQLIRKLCVSVMGFGYYHAPIIAQQKAYLALCEAASRGDIPLSFETLPLSRIAEAWERQKTGSGKRQVLMLESGSQI